MRQNKYGRMRKTENEGFIRKISANPVRLASVRPLRESALPLLSRRAVLTDVI
jgi:hypothetical protein